MFLTVHALSMDQSAFLFMFAAPEIALTNLFAVAVQIPAPPSENQISPLLSRVCLPFTHTTFINDKLSLLFLVYFFASLNSVNFAKPPLPQILFSDLS
jgi:hypothetical protein